MAQLPPKVKNVIDSYLLALKQNNIPIQEAILFLIRKISSRERS